MASEKVLSIDQHRRANEMDRRPVMAIQYRQLAKRCYRLAILANETTIADGFDQMGDRFLRRADQLALDHE